MRIVSGSAKGKKILVPIDKKTRPLKDIVKESIFNIICTQICCTQRLKVQIF